MLLEENQCVIDIYQDAIKIGMVSSSGLIDEITERLRFYHAKNIIVDPVMVATSGSTLMKNDAVQTLINQLLPLATLVTPNIPEAQVLSGMVIRTKEDMLVASKKIGDSFHCEVLQKVDIVSMMLMIYSMKRVNTVGSKVNGFIIQILMGPDAPFLAL